MAAARRAKDKVKRKTMRTRSAEPSASEIGIPSAIEDLAPTARELLEAARRLLETQDYSALTLRQLAARQGKTSH